MFPQSHLLQRLEREGDRNVVVVWNVHRLPLMVLRQRVCRKGRTRRESLALLFQSQSLPWCVEIFAMSSFQARLRLESSCFDSTLLIAKQSFFEVKVITAFVLQSVHWPQGADFSFLCHMRHYRRPNPSRQPYKFFSLSHGVLLLPLYKWRDRSQL